jgi:SAM-dependent MidA family methyltransferase
MSDPDRGAASADDARKAAARELLRRATDAQGFVPFDRFMEVALYGEGVGFYTRPDSPFGREGDYYTAAHASPLFGRAVAERVRTALASIPKGIPARIVEIGPGDGTLGETLVAGLAAGERAPGLSEVVIVERSTSLSRRALDRISSAARPLDVAVSVAESMGALGPFHGVVIANELLDAQPTRRLVWTGREWQETGVRWAGDRFVRAAVPAIRPVPAPELPSELPPGTIVEVSPMAGALVREVADHLVSGLFLVLDYGMEERELVTAHPSGTLAAIRRHRYVDDPFADPGSSDLSAFVNFTRLRSVARTAGFREVAFRRQAEALGEWGLPRLLEEAVRAAPSAEAEVRTRLAAKNLAFGFERFYALELEPAPPSADASAGPVT